MQIVEFGPRKLSLPHLVHGRRVTGSPSVRKPSPINLDTFGFAPGAAFLNDGAAPIDHCSERVEYQRFNACDCAGYRLGLLRTQKSHRSSSCETRQKPSTMDFQTFISVLSIASRGDAVSGAMASADCGGYVRLISRRANCPRSRRPR